MQTPQDFSLDRYENIDENTLKKIIFPLQKGDKICLIGDLGAGKSTFTRILLRTHFHDPHMIVRSPTYTYFERYHHDLYTSIYHFDLYRIESETDLFLIGAEDILEDPDSICIVEWPEILGADFPWTKKIHIEKMSDTTRTFSIFQRKL